MSQSPVDLQAYLGTYNLLAQEIEGLSDEQVRWKPAADKWSILEVLTHLADHNLVVAFRARELLADSTAVLPAFSQDQWVAGQYANEGQAEEVLHFFYQLLLYNYRLFTRLSEADWYKSGTNFKGQEVRLVDAIQAFIDHARGHLGQIRRTKQGLQAEVSG